MGHLHLNEAARQQRQLLHLTNSEIQPVQFNAADLTQWAANAFQTNDEFLRWVCAIFKEDNFVLFFNHLRYPLPSAKLVKNKIAIDLERVFFAEDSYFKYTIDGEDVQIPEELQAKEFNQIIFDALLYRYNDIVITDLKETNTPFRFILSINDVVSIDSFRSVISRIAYTANMVDENGIIIEGFIFIDNKEYIFYDKEFKNNPIVFPHDLQETPADYIASKPFSQKTDIVREGIFSFQREEFEEYVFLKTIQKMTEPNGAIPITVRLKTDPVTKTDNKFKGDLDGNALQMSTDILYPGVRFPKKIEKPITQAGTDIGVQLRKKSDGSVDMGLVKDFIHFHHIPKKQLDYLDKRLRDIEHSLIAGSTGDFVESNESAQNELQIERSYIGKQDKLRGLSKQLTRIRKRSDFKFLALEHGRERVTVDLFFGADHFIETQAQLYSLLKNAPNSIERQTLLIRLVKNRARFNPERGERDVILYKLMPYCSDSEFTVAISNNAVGPTTFVFQNQFNRWIILFESQFGDILQFWNMFDVSESEKIILITNIILDLIKETHEQPVATSGRDDS